MNLITRLATLALLVFAFGVSNAIAQRYPAKPIHIVVPFPAGGATDVGTRVIGQKMAESWGQPVVVENRPGANTIIGAEAVAKAAPDGYTLLMAIDSTLVMNQSLYNKLPYDPLKDFAPVTRTFSTRPILVVDAATWPKSVQELIQQAKANPGKLNFGAGTITTRLGGELFKSLAGIDIVYVPYKGSAGTVQGLLSGDLRMIVDGVTANLSHIKNGKFRALAGLSSRPIPALPNLPTLAEAAGLPGFDVEVWQGLVAPAGTPLGIVNQLPQEMVGMLNLSEVNEKLTLMGVYPGTSTPAEFAAFIPAEAERWSKVIKQAGIRIE